MNRAVQVISQSRALTGEGPFVDSSTGCIIWVDLPVGDVYTTDPNTGREERQSFDTVIGAVVPTQSGGLAAAVADGFALLGARLSLADAVLVGRDLRMNDGACDARGRFWAGSTRLDGARGGSLHVWDGVSISREVVRDLVLPNGLGWSPDNKQMFHIETAEHRVRVADFDVDDGALGTWRELVQFPGEWPDGMCVAADGSIWVALFGSGAVVRISPTGEVIERIELPVPHATSCALAPDGTLYVTTARHPLSPEEQAQEPLAGKLLAVSTTSEPTPTYSLAR